MLDYAVLVISGADGVQGHVMTLWNLLMRYRIPVFLFVNKMDQPGTDREALMRNCRNALAGSALILQRMRRGAAAYRRHMMRVFPMMRIAGKKILTKRIMSGFWRISLYATKSFWRNIWNREGSPMGRLLP